MTHKTWGPFTGNHLTAIAGFIILAIAVPGGLWAADPFSNAAIYDPISGNTAAVASNKQLLIGDGSGALTVDGSLIATQTRPADFYHYGHGLPISICYKVGIPPASKALIVKTIIVFNTKASAQTDYSMSFFIGATCAGSVLIVPVAARGVITIPVEPGFAVPQGQFLWAKATGSTSLWGGVRVVGYTVPASTVPAAVAIR